MNQVISLRTLGRLLLVGVSACSSAQNPGEPADTSTTSHVVRTAVHVHADGTETVTTTFVPRDQAEADADARTRLRQERLQGNVASSVHAAPSPEYVPPPDATCNPNDVWLYDGAGTGTTCPPAHNNEICFAFDPSATNGARDSVCDLSDYARCLAHVCIRGLCRCFETGTWKDGVGAYWPGISSGMIEGQMTTPPYDPFESFNAWGACTTVSDAADPNALRYASILIIAPP